MGLFSFNEEEFLDPDEIRLRRESEARQRKSHRACAANHADDIGSTRPVVSNTTHKNCKADHRDDLAGIKFIFIVPILILILMIVTFVIGLSAVLY